MDLNGPKMVQNHRYFGSWRVRKRSKTSKVTKKTSTKSGHWPEKWPEKGQRKARKGAKVMPKQHQNEIAENAEIEQHSDGVLVVSNHIRYCNAELFLPFQRHQPAATETAATLLGFFTFSLPPWKMPKLNNSLMAFLVVSNHIRYCNAELFLPFQRHQPAATETAATLLGFFTFSLPPWKMVLPASWKKF